MKRLRQINRQAKGHDAAFDDLMDHVRADTDRELDELGKAVYADQWPAVLAHNTKRMAGEQGGLTLSQKWQLIKALRVLKAQRL